MDIIGSIQYIENRLGGYNSKQDKSKLAPKNTRNHHAAYLKNEGTDTNLSSTEHDAQLGRIIDTTA